ncbi:UNVERIFIED_CONTAM: hypothetical protein FKN15_048879 [Acipenser sinensis]
MDMSMESTSQKTSSRSAVSKDMELQVCVCGWSKATTVRGLKIHQGRMKCLREKGQGPRIDQYFLRSQSSQSNEIQRQEANHSSQDISTPVIDVRRTCMDTVSDEPNDPCEPGQTNQHKREKNLNGHKPGVKWPRACEKTAWDTVNTDLCFALERLSGTVEKKLDKFGDIIYAYGSESYFLVCDITTLHHCKPSCHNPPEYQMEDCAPKWKEVEQAVKKPRASSSPGPNEVPYRVQECFWSYTNPVETILVRASNLQDLVYKNGQAGITKATVSITFDNSDKKQSPLGFEAHDEITVTRQVVIGGRNKYLINGVNANNTRVQDLFCSVGLNVNNPHFLIMQGRITKVLNMKPPEILAMIEEAAGTRMYECKKIAAHKTIEKKEAKLKEIQTILEEEITPTLQKLKEERSSYLEYQKVMREIEHLSRLYVAYLFVCAEETKVKSAEDLKEMQDSIGKLQQNMAENERKVKELSQEIAELEKKRDKDVGGVLRSLEDTLSEVQRVDTKAQSALDLKKQNLKGEEKKRKELVNSMGEVGASSEITSTPRSSTILVVQKLFRYLKQCHGTLYEESEEVLKKTKEVQKKAEEKYKVLENKMKNAEAEREKELKEAQQKLNTAKKKADISNKKMKEKQQEADALVLELEELKREQAAYEQQIEAVDEAMKSIQEHIDSMVSEVSKNKEAVKKAQEELAKQKEIILTQDKEIKDKLSEASKLREQNNDAQLKIKELEHNINKHKKDSADATARYHKGIHVFKKIMYGPTEKHLFGQPNTAYDFKTNNPKEAGQRLKKLQETKEKLGRNVNMRAMNMLSQAEERYNDLMKKKRIVENDKSKILTTIEELDQKKNEALNIAWQKVNKDFGSIFSTLLPGADARLAPPEGKSVLDGLEFKVALGNIWKENLTELSGGQRSLVALSLILAMLLFKPAPIYILDEVDAALDLSHTQNIGQMLRTHFRHSQFIVVSLKDGMFNNANVLFKTKFVDGVSTVARFAQSQNGVSKAGQNRPDKTKSKDKHRQHTEN